MSRASREPTNSLTAVISGESQRSCPGPPESAFTRCDKAAVTGDGVSGARSANARAPASISMATTSRKAAKESRSFRAACQPIETWSSCMPEGRYRVDAGRRSQSLHLRDESRLGVLGNHEARIDARLVREKRRQAVAAVHVQEAVRATLGHRGYVGQNNREKVQARRQSERRESFRSTPANRPPVPRDCQSTLRVPRRRPAWRSRRCHAPHRETCGAQRSE